MKLVVIGALLLVGLVGATLLLKNNDSSTAAENSVPQLTIQAIDSDTVSGGQLLDVRTTAEFAEGHIKRAVNLPLQDIQAGRLPEATKDKPVYVYCRSGSRSRQATELLKKAGYQAVVDLGAMTSVQSLGGQVIK